MRDRMHRKFLDRLEQKVDEKNLPPRSDMYLADYQPIDAMKCNVLIGYDNHVAGPPKRSQIERFVEATWHGKVHAQSQTMQIHEGQEAVSCLITIHADTRPMTDTLAMRRIMAGAYQDDETGAIWQVADSGTQKYLMRRPDIDITRIIADSVKRVSRKQATFDHLRTAAPMMAEGDTVRFYDGAMPMIGKVTSLKGDQVTISANNKSYAVAREAVFNVVERSDGELSDNQNLLESYWARAVGNQDWARKFTRKLNRQQDPMGEDSGWSGGTGN